MPSNKSRCLEQLKHVVLDLDGTIYLDERLFKETKPFLADIADMGIGHTFITNNNSRSRAEYLAFMRSLDLNVSEESLFTSAHATINYLQQHLPNVRRPYILGTDGLKEDCQLAGYHHEAESPDAVIIGFDRTLTYQTLSKAAYWIDSGLPYLATHPDRICPTKELEVLVDCGALCAMVESATGRAPDAIPGKPSPAMMEGILHKYQLKPTEAAMVGDRIYTDMKMAQSAGMVSVLTLTGEATREQVATAESKPDLVISNLAEFTEHIRASRT